MDSKDKRVTQKVKGEGNHISFKYRGYDVGPGKKFTAAQKKKILDMNRAKNGGVLKSDMSGNVLDNPVQSKKGVRANMNQAEVDHIQAKSKGGSNSFKNAQVLSKGENIKKRDN